MLKKFIFALLVLVFSTGLQAQDTFMNIKDEPLLTHEDISLNGMCSTTFLSPNGDLAIESSNKEDIVEKPVQRPDGQWAYTVISDPKKNSDRKFIISQKETSISSDVKRTIEPYLSRTLSVSVVKQKISLNNQTTPSFYPEAGKACIEITTPLENMKIGGSKTLVAGENHTRNAAGAEEISVIIDVDAMQAMSRKAEAAKAAADAQTLKIDSTDGDLPDSEYDLEEQLKEKAAQAQVELNEALYITIYGDDTNCLVIPAGDIANLTSKSKILYGVLLLDKIIYEDPRLNAAQDLINKRKYADAAAVFKEVVDSGNCSDAMLSAYQDKIVELERWGGISKDAAVAFALFKEEKKKPQARVNVLEECLLKIIGAYGILYDETSDDFFRRNRESSIEQYNKLPLVVEGVTNISDLKQGRRLVNAQPGVKIYQLEQPYRGKYKGKRLKEIIGYSMPIATSDAEGKFKVEISPRSRYRTLLFVDEKHGAEALPLDGKSNLKADITLGK